MLAPPLYIPKEVVNYYLLLNRSHPCFQEVVQRLVAQELYEKYSQLNVQQFVDSCADVKWCPFPNCGLAVGLQEVGGAKSDDMVKRKRGGPGDHQRLNVECEQGHGFCW